MKKASWAESASSAKVVVLGAGSWGTVLAQLAAQNAQEVRLCVREEARAGEMNSTRQNTKYTQGMHLHPGITAMADLGRVFSDEVDFVIWALPSKVCRAEAKKIAPYLKGNEVLLHATKGVEDQSLKRISEILLEELPLSRIGVISGPNLADEIARGEPAGAVIASRFAEVAEAGEAVLRSSQFRTYRSKDVVGIEWAGVLKNILAIASGALDTFGFGWNARALLLSRGLAEMVRFTVAMGGDMKTLLGLAGMGDLLATCSSPLSRNYRVGQRLARGEPLEKVLLELGSTAEGVRTALSVSAYAQQKDLELPITHTVASLVRGERGVQDALRELMIHPGNREL